MADRFSIWDTNNVTVEVAYAIMSVLFVVQATYAVTKRASVAFQFDVTMAIGCAMPLGIWLKQHWI